MEAVLKQALKQVFRLTAVVIAHGTEACVQGERWMDSNAHVSSRDGQTRGLRWRTANYLQRRVIIDGNGMPPTIDAIDVVQTQHRLVRKLSV